MSRSSFCICCGLKLRLSRSACSPARRLPASGKLRPRPSCAASLRINLGLAVGLGLGVLTERPGHALIHLRDRRWNRSARHCDVGHEKLPFYFKFPMMPSAVFDAFFMMLEMASNTLERRSMTI